MCGIAGEFNCPAGPRPDADVIGRMARALAHRGPDDEGVQIGDYWALASRRLAIIGVAAGHQPLANEDGTVWVVFNGEIYNHRELRAQLERDGHVLATTTDTEVLVHLYEEHGSEMLSRVHGMFAFAVVDLTRGKLMLARDRLGQKPLFYHVSQKGDVVFASELRALLLHPGVPRELNVQALHDYLSLCYVPAPGTIFKDVRKLPPASFVEFDSDTLEAPAPVRCWCPSYATKHDLTFEEASAQLRELLDRAVAKRLESEVPLGAFLSGGLDSSIVVALMQRHLSSSVRAFTIGFEDARYDESDYARMAAAHVGAEHRLRVAQPKDVSLLRRLIRHYGEPFCDSSMLPTALLSDFTREHVTVALSGDGGDEVFGGYQRYQVMALQQYLQRIPIAWRRPVCELILKALPRPRELRSALGAVRRLLAVVGADDVRSYATFQQAFSESAKEALYGPDCDASALTDYVGHWEEILRRGSAADFVERFMELDLHTYLPSDLLCKVDIASMMFSLEVRCPFLDHELIEFAAVLPRRFKVSIRQRKRVLKHCVRDLIPAELRQRGKRGFGVPVSQWLREDLSPLVTDMCADADWDTAGVLDFSALRRLAQEHVSGAEDHGARLWALLCFKLWSEEISGF